MAITPRSSTTITNITANPSVSNSPPRGARRLIHLREVIASAADDTAASIYRFFRVRSSDTVVSLKISAADATTAGALDIGLYDTAENGGVVVDRDLFASAFDLSGGPFNNSDITFESGEYTYAESLMPLWQALGLSADPYKEYDVAAYVTTTFNGGPTSILLCADAVR
jgi:hypothetical protein